MAGRRCEMDCTATSKKRRVVDGEGRVVPVICSRAACGQHEDKWFCRMHLSTAEIGDSICAVCLGDFLGSPRSDHVTSHCCRKAFHRHCLTQWTWSKDTCPNCRAPPSMAQMRDVHQPDLDALCASLLALPGEARLRVKTILENALRDAVKPSIAGRRITLADYVAEDDDDVLLVLDDDDGAVR